MSTTLNYDELVIKKGVAIFTYLTTLKLSHEIKFYNKMFWELKWTKTSSFFNFNCSLQIEKGLLLSTN